MREEGPPLNNCGRHQLYPSNVSPLEAPISSTESPTQTASNVSPLEAPILSTQSPNLTHQLDPPRTNQATNPSSNCQDSESAETGFSGPQFESEDAVDGEILSLSDALSGLSTKDTGTVGRAKYYSVVVGRCCGVYSSWATVHPLVLGLPGSVFSGFRTYEGAYWDYYTSKQQGKVKVVRGPFDDFIFGPISKACM